jgi:uncharacterized membrane protein
MESSSETLCQYCGKMFFNEVNLRRHQAQTIKCLQLQNKSPQALRCGYCQKKTFYTKGSFDNHQATCVYKIHKDLFQKIRDLAAEILEKNKIILSQANIISAKEQELIEAQNQLVLSKKSR